MLRGTMVLWLLMPPAADAQSRLDQMEATYQAKLRELQAPMLQDYVRQLDFLKGQFVAKNRTEDAQQVDAEIARVKGIIATTGVLPYKELRGASDASTSPAPGSPPAPTPSPVPTPPSPPPAKSSPVPLPTLLATDSTNTTELNRTTEAVPLGSAEWTGLKLPAGTYDVLLVFASGPLKMPEAIVLSIDGQEFKGVVTTDRATGSPETFRLLRLCQVALPSEVSSGTFRISSRTADKPVVWLKKVMFAVPKKPAPAPAK